MYTLPLVCVLAVPAADPEPVRWQRLTLTPAAAPSPVLRHPLLPDVLEQRPGNAAPHYARATVLLRRDVPQPVRNALYEWSELPLGGLPKEDVRQALALAEPALAEAECGALCETCDWELSTRLRRDGIATILEEVQQMRELNLFLIMRMRLELADGRTRRAVRTASLSLALARHAADQPTLINALVGVALASRTLHVLEDEMQRPDAPNLYWSLTDLPRPFADLRKPLHGERLTAYGTFPHRSKLADLDAEPLRPEEVKELADRVIGISRGLDVPVFNRAALAALLVRKHDTSKKALIEAGRPAGRVEAMTPLEVSLLHSFLEYERALDDVLALQSLPYWEAQPRMEKIRIAQRRLPRNLAQAMRGDGPLLPLAGLFVPATEKVLMARTRLDRRIAALRCVEALRLHAAAHGGRWPERLEDVTEVPVPIDPATGKPFDYRVAGDKAFLSGPDVFPGAPNPAVSIRYELILRKEEK
jgi:hypothetical protein